MIGNTVIQSILFQYELGLNNYLGFVGWAMVLVIRISNERPGRYGTALLLVLGTLSLLNFTIGTITMAFFIGPLGIGFNPVILIIMIAYYFVNKKPINQVLSKLTKGSAEERQTERQKLVDFYLHKFKTYDSSEFGIILKNFNEYPDEAQEAIKRICRLRGITQTTI